MNAEDIGRFIREERSNMGMSQKTLADLIHVSVKTVSKWETGRGYPNISVLQNLAKILRTTTDKLLDGSPIPDSRDNRLDYENTDNPLQDTDYEGIWIIKPFHTMEQTIKKAPLVHLQVINKQTNEVVLDILNCVSCWEGICGWNNQINKDLTLITSAYKQYIIKKDLYKIVNPVSMREIG